MSLNVAHRLKHHERAYHFHDFTGDFGLRLSFRFLLIYLFSFSGLAWGATLDSGLVTMDITGTSPSDIDWPGNVDNVFSSSARLAVTQGGSSTFASVSSSLSNTEFLEPAGSSTEQYSGTFTTSVTHSFSGTMTARAYGSEYGILQNAVVLIYTYTNTGTSTLDSVYPGLYFDLDVGPTTTNASASDETRDLFYQFDNNNPPVIMGMRVLSGQVHSAHFRPLGDSVFSSASHLTDGVQTTTGEFTDQGCSISQRYTNVAPGQTIVFAVGIFFGSTLTDLQAVSDAASNIAVGAGGAGGASGGAGFGGATGGQPKIPTYGGSSYTLPSSGGGGGCLLKP